MIHVVVIIIFGVHTRFWQITSNRPSHPHLRQSHWPAQDHRPKMRNG